MKPIDVDEFFNRRFIISELEHSLNNDESIDASVVPEGKKEASVVAKVHKYARTVDEVGEVDEEVESTVVPEKIN